MHVTKNVSEAIEILVKHGFDINTSGDMIEVRKLGVVNPADIRTRISEILSQFGYQAYYLKEVYAFMGSKNPWRTDAEGFVEFEPWDDTLFTRVVPSDKKKESTDTKRLKPKITDQTVIKQLGQ